MSCTSHIMTVSWTHHSWRTHVVSSEVLTSQETNMWARPVYRDYVRCDKQEVCAACGTVGRTWSCVCDMERGERCAPRLAWMAQAQQHGEPLQAPSA